MAAGSHLSRCQLNRKSVTAFTLPSVWQVFVMTLQCPVKYKVGSGAPPCLFYRKKPNPFPLQCSIWNEARSRGFVHGGHYTSSLRGTLGHQTVHRKTASWDTYCWACVPEEAVSSPGLHVGSRTLTGLVMSYWRCDVLWCSTWARRITCSKILTPFLSNLLSHIQTRWRRSNPQGVDTSYDILCLIVPPPSAFHQIGFTFQFIWQWQTHSTMNLQNLKLIECR